MVVLMVTRPVSCSRCDAIHRSDGGGSAAAAASADCAAAAAAADIGGVHGRATSEP